MKKIEIHYYWYAMNLYQYLYLECRHRFVGGQCVFCEVRIGDFDAVAS